jgi:hypothetical protein
MIVLLLWRGPGYLYRKNTPLQTQCNSRIFQLLEICIHHFLSDAPHTNIVYWGYVMGQHIRKITRKPGEINLYCKMPFMHQFTCKVQR